MNYQKLLSLRLPAMLFGCLMLMTMCTPYSRAQISRCLSNRPCYSRFSARGQGGGAVIGIGLAYTLYNAIYHAVPYPQATPIPNTQPWKCTAFVTLSSPYVATEMLVMPTRVAAHYAVAHTLAYKDCKRYNKTLSNGCEIMCYQ